MSAVIETTSRKQPEIGVFNNESVKLRQITVEEYDLMIESGVFDENDQIELLNGVIVEKMPKERNIRRQTSARPEFFTEISEKMH